ncbi:hypothetical protein QE152_g17023 [Popillia japonica]|uniref:PiggyBac transposable element-derived protein domain-containing protein n=1 Tax=Popillia japonica TaxID=7064 RepID=A0AAW1L5G2_POPJA
MRGVDLLDQLIILYRIFIRSRKWTLRVAMHMIDFVLVNSWLEYKKDCAKRNVPNNSVLHLLDFRIHVAESLIKLGRNNVPNNSVLHLLDFRIHVAESLIKLGRNVEPNNRGRPSTSSSPAVVPPPRRNHVEMRPFHEIQTDRVDHMPQFDD